MPDKPEHELAIDAADHTGSVQLLFETAECHRLSEDGAEGIVNEVSASLRTWERVAKTAKLGAAEMDVLDEAISA